jgi:exodeoxyribonuclease VII large subunit
LRVHVERRRERYDVLGLRLTTARGVYVATHRTRIVRARERVLGLGERARLAFGTLWQAREARLERAERLLTAVSYRAILARGFALVRDLGGKPVRQAAAVSTGDRLDVEFVDGRVCAVAEVTRIAPTPSRPRLRTRRGLRNPGQGSLFGE